MHATHGLVVDVPDLAVEEGVLPLLHGELGLGVQEAWLGTLDHGRA